MDPPETLRERKRRAVRADLVSVALGLFVEHGYEATTVEQIAAEVGMSERTFFRYFPSKEALVLGKYDRFGDAMIERLAERPLAEPAWTALRHMFDYIIEYERDTAEHSRAAEVDRVVMGSDALRAAYLERMSSMQEGVAQLLAERLAGVDEARAVVAAAFACMSTANRTVMTRPIPLADALDAAMDAVAAASAGARR